MPGVLDGDIIPSTALFKALHYLKHRLSNSDAPTFDMLRNEAETTFSQDTPASRESSLLAHLTMGMA